jgi:hypothetical protein
MAEPKKEIGQIRSVIEGVVVANPNLRSEILDLLEEIAGEIRKEIDDGNDNDDAGFDKGP